VWNRQNTETETADDKKALIGIGIALVLIILGVTWLLRSPARILQ
jgi:hypothetical protein